MTWVRACNSNRSSQLGQNYWTVLKREHWSHARLATLTKWLISTQRAQWMLLFLVLSENSSWFRILRSYMLLLKSPVLMRSCPHNCSKDWISRPRAERCLGTELISGSTVTPLTQSDDQCIPHSRHRSPGSNTSFSSRMQTWSLQRWWWG